MSGVDKEYEDMLLNSWEKPYTQLDYVIYKERKVGMKIGKRIHTKKLHDYHMERFGHCLYCKEGYVIGTHEEIIKEIDKR